jgi:hypothetical protein
MQVPSDEGDRTDDNPGDDATPRTKHQTCMSSNVIGEDDLEAQRTVLQRRGRPGVLRHRRSGLVPGVSRRLRDQRSVPVDSRNPRLLASRYLRGVFARLRLSAGRGGSKDVSSGAAGHAVARALTVSSGACARLASATRAKGAPTATEGKEERRPPMAASPAIPVRRRTLPMMTVAKTRRGVRVAPLPRLDY